MHTTPVSMARPKLANSSPIISASPTSIRRTLAGRPRTAGSWRTASVTSPRPRLPSSISKFTLRERS